MNKRQKLKKLKKEQERLKRENDLMHRIINNTDEMKQLLGVYNEPVKNVITTTMRFEEYKVKRDFPPEFLNDEKAIKYLKQDITRQLAQKIEENIIYEIEENTFCEFGKHTQIRGRIYIGKP